VKHGELSHFGQVSRETEAVIFLPTKLEKYANYLTVFAYSRRNAKRCVGQLATMQKAIF